MAHEIVQNIIKRNRGVIKSEEQFKRTVRGKEGEGYPFLSDKEITSLWAIYLEEVSE